MVIKIDTKAAERRLRGYARELRTPAAKEGLRREFENSMRSTMTRLANQLRDKIRNDFVTKTGEERKQSGRGKYAGRSETDEMAKSFGFGLHTGDSRSNVKKWRIGFRPDSPYYTIFQEKGTAGIVGMDILNDPLIVEAYRDIIGNKHILGKKRMSLEEFLGKNYKTIYEQPFDSGEDIY